MPSIFALEALYAGKGDALLLHHGSDKHPRWILIDGGHHHVYEVWLGPRLVKLRKDNVAHVDATGRLQFDMLMVSHADEDHVKGLLDLLRHLDDGGATREPAPVDFAEIWFNAFDDLLASKDVGLIRTQSVLRAASAEGGGSLDLPNAVRGNYEIQSVLASTKQGVELRDLANKLAIPMNSAFATELICRDGAKPSKDLEPLKGVIDLKMTVLGPDQPRITKARDRWAKDLGGTNQRDTQLQSFADNSPHNLASVMVLVERGGKSMLLTGDGRGDHLVEGLAAQGLLEKGKGLGRIHVDLFKLPHHGSVNNTTESTFETITADHYVVSANGEHNNPMTETLDMLEKGRAAAGLNSDYSIYFTFPAQAFESIDEQDPSSKQRKRRAALKKLDTWTRSSDRPSHCHFVYREPKEFGVTVDLVEVALVLGATGSVTGHQSYVPGA